MKPSTGRYYKVLRRMNRKLYSAVVPPPVKIQYEEGVRVEGEYGPLLVFASQLFALAFAGRLKKQAAFYKNSLVTYEVWGCEVENPVHVHFLLYYLEARNTATVEEWWKNPDDHGTLDIQDAPAGTVAVDALILTRRVDE